MGKKISVIKDLKKSFGFKIREARSIRHDVRMYWKEMHKEFEVDKSKHIVPKRFNKGHKAWSINGEET